MKLTDNSAFASALSERVRVGPSGRQTHHIPQSYPVFRSNSPAMEAPIFNRSAPNNFLDERLQGEKFSSDARGKRIKCVFGIIRTSLIHYQKGRSLAHISPYQNITNRLTTTIQRKKHTGFLIMDLKPGLEYSVEFWKS